MNTYKTDPIVAEIRAIRAKQAARFENDPAAIIEHAQALQEASGRNYVRYRARRLKAAASRRKVTGMRRN